MSAAYKFPRTHFLSQEKQREGFLQLGFMAEKQTPPDEGDDDFGDFTFASSSIFSPPNPRIDGDDGAEEDDDWGDFVTTPKSNGVDNQQLQDHQQSGDFFNSVPDRMEPQAKKGVKTREALPLSLFGDEEAEKEDDNGVGFGGATELFRGKSGDSAKKRSELGGLGISDLLASLYDQGGGGAGSGKMQDNSLENHQENGFRENGSNLATKESVLDLHSNGFSPTSNISKQAEGSKAENGQRMELDESLFDFNVMNSATDGFSFSAKAYNQTEEVKAENGRRTKSDESLFSFLMMSSGTDVFSSDVKPYRTTEAVKIQNGWSENTDESISNLNLLSFDSAKKEMSNVVPCSVTADLNCYKLNTDTLSKSPSTEYDDDDEEGWEFQSTVNLNRERKDDMQLEFHGFNPGGKLDSNGSESNADHGGGDFQGTAKHTVKDADNSGWDIQGFANTTSKERDDYGWDFQGTAKATPRDGDDGGWDFQGMANPPAKDENSGGWDFQGNTDSTTKDADNVQWEFQAIANPAGKVEKDEWDFQAAPGDQNPEVIVEQLEIPQITKLMPPLYGSIDNQTDLFASTEDDHFSKVHQDSSVLGKDYVDDSIWDFKDSSSETISKFEVSKVTREDRKRALPPSLFSDQSFDADESGNQDVFSFNPTPSLKKDFQNLESYASLSDLIQNLYSQAEKNSSVESPQQAVSNELDSIQFAQSANLVNDEDSDSSWEFRDANIPTTDEKSSFHEFEVHLNDKHASLEVDNFVDFYYQLKHQSRLAAICHLESLKEVKRIAEISHKDTEVEALTEQIQDAIKKLHCSSITPDEIPENHTPHSFVSEFLQVLTKPKFRMLESEYGLSRRLSAAEKDLRSAIELVEHAASILSILSRCSVEEQYNYISTWTKILFVCAQELQHGTSIWTRVVKKNVQSQILSQTKGKNFFSALGEIYRVVKILEATCILYRPWILASSMDPDSIYTLLKECSALWSSSGLEDILKEISYSSASGSGGEILTLLESINRCHELDVHRSYSTEQDEICSLSLLTAAVVPDVKMVAWNGEHFFLPLANFWANLISSDPPKLRRG